MATKQEVLRAHLKEWLATKQYGKERRKLRDQLAQPYKYIETLWVMSFDVSSTLHKYEQKRVVIPVYT